MDALYIYAPIENKKVWGEKKARALILSKRMSNNEYARSTGDEDCTAIRTILLRRTVYFLVYCK